MSNDVKQFKNVNDDKNVFIDQQVKNNFDEQNWKKNFLDLKEENLVLKEKNILLKEKMLLSKDNYHKFIVKIFNFWKWLEFLNEMTIYKIKFIKSFDNHFVEENLVVISILNKDFNKFFSLLESVIEKNIFIYINFFLKKIEFIEILFFHFNQ